VIAALAVADTAVTRQRQITDGSVDLSVALRYPHVCRGDPVACRRLRRRVAD
jgi:hypothetical protein